MCCDWWKKIVYPAFDVPESTYRALGNLIFAPNIQTITLNVNDNRFNKTKAQILYDMLSRSRLRGFTFVNSAMYFDYENNEYSNFK